MCWAQRLEHLSTGVCIALCEFLQGCTTHQAWHLEKGGRPHVAACTLHSTLKAPPWDRAGTLALSFPRIKHHFRLSQVTCEARHHPGHTGTSTEGVGVHAPGACVTLSGSLLSGPQDTPLLRELRASGGPSGTGGLR